MEDLTKQTKVLIHEIHNGLAHVEKASDTEAELMAQTVFSRLDTAFSNCERLEHLVKKIPPNQREEAKLHIDKMKYDCKHLQSSLQGIQHRRSVSVSVCVLFTVHCSLNLSRVHSTVQKPSRTNGKLT